MAVIETWYNQDLKNPVKVHYLHGNVFSQDNQGNLLGVHVFDNGEPAILAGTVSGSVIRPDGTTIAITGTRSGNDCYIILPQSAYAVVGAISIVIKLAGSGSTTTLCAVVANVYQTSTDTIVDPGTIIPDISALIESIEQAVDSIPLDYSALSNGFRDAMETQFGTSAPGTYSNVTIKRSDGTTTASTVYKTTGFIPVTGGDVLFTTSPAVNATVLSERATIAFYSSDAASGYISSEPFTNGTPATLVWGSAKIPNGATHLRITIEGTLTDQFKCIQIKSLESVLSDYVSNDALAAILANYINSITAVSSWTGNPYSTLADLPDNTLCRTTGAPDRPEWQLSDSGMWVLTIHSPGTYNRTQIALNSANGGIGMRFAFDSAKTYSAWTKRYIDAQTLATELTNYVENQTLQETLADYVDSISPVSSWTGNPYSTLADLPDNTLCRTTGAPDRPEWQSSTAGLWVMTICSPGTNNRTQIAINSANGAMQMRFAFDSAKTYSAWAGEYVGSVVQTRQNITSWGGENDDYSTLADLPQNTFFRTYYAPDRPDGQIATAGFWVLTLKTYLSDYWVQYGFGASTGIVAMRYRSSASADYSDWVLVSGAKKKIRVLCIGNSYTQDNIAYVPFILKRIAPDIDFTFGISYYSGARIDQYIDFFDNDTRVLMYSKIGSNDSAWTTWGTNTTTPNPNQKTLKEILSDEPWDIITIQQGSAYMASWSTFSNLNAYVDRIITYLRGLGLRHIRIGWLMPQMRKAMEDDPTYPNYTYENMIDCVQKVIQTSPLSFVIPCGTAIQNARNTSLDALGDNGHMTYDENGHLQEGVPCLVGAYAGTLKLLELAGEPYVGILAENTFPDGTWLTGKAIPIAHGSASGVTSANCYLAQKCAVASVKFPYEVTDIE